MAGLPGDAKIGTLVSEISCLGDSSIHTTGYSGLKYACIYPGPFPYLLQSFHYVPVELPTVFSSFIGLNTNLQTRLVFGIKVNPSGMLRTKNYL